LKTIGDLLSRDLGQKIEEIIKVNQTDENTVYTEINEYVVTDRIRDEYFRLLRAIADAPRDPDEGIGVWVSGFFGSGKSSFSKNLGYILANQTVLGHKAADLFKSRVTDRRLTEYLDYINTSIPTEVIMFDVSVDRAVKRSTERIAEIMYTVLLRELDYAEDYDIAELEIELEREDKLDQFIADCQIRYGDWHMIRKGAQKISRASAILHNLDPVTYPTQDSWSQSLHNKSADITVGKFVERTFELCSKRRPGKGLVFIIDEVGQYVARSADKIEDLRAVVEQFGRVSKNLVQARKAVAPIWIVVTSQEKLDEVVAALDSKRVELAKLQDRFKHRVDLAPADIREVATRRVLAKKDEALPFLRKMYGEFEGQLNVACRLERTSRSSKVSEEDFIQFYPYLPHFVELSIDIMSGIRLQPGADKHLGGSNRTIIKQAYEMLVSERTALAAQPPGTLVSLDKIFELVEGNLTSEKQKDISDISQRFKHDPEDHGMAARVAKAICLLEFVKDLPRTEANIAAVLVTAVGQQAQLAEVQKVLEKLKKYQFARNTDEGWKLQTAQEKSWQKERDGYKDPKPKEENDIIREALREIFNDPKIRIYRYRDLKNFPIGVTVEGVRLGDEGKVPLAVSIADSEDHFKDKLVEIRNESRQPQHSNDIYWIFALTAELNDLIDNLYASRQMVSKYDQLRVQSRINNDEAACLQAEKSEVLQLQLRLRDKLGEALEKGQGLFRGVSKDAAGLGKNLPEILKKLFDFAVPDLYQKLEMGARPLKGNEAEEILKAANLNALSKIFYDGPQGFNLVTKEGSKYVPNPDCDVAKELLDYLNREHSYGNKDSRIGKVLEAKFGGLGYGWDLEVLKLVLAVLFRAGSIEISYAGRRFDSYQEPQSRQTYTSNTTFRQTLFTPSKPLDLLTLTRAVSSYEDLTGQTVDVEKNAIALAFRKVAEQEREYLVTLEAQSQANRLPLTQQLQEYRTVLTTILGGAADDCVRILSGEGSTFKEERANIHRMREASDEKGLAVVRHGRSAVREMWPALKVRGVNPELEQTATVLQDLLDSPTFYECLPEIGAKSGEIVTAYHQLYAGLHNQRTKDFEVAVEEIKGQVEWASLSAELQPTVLSLLSSRVCVSLGLPSGATICQHCKATPNQMDSDLAALGGLKSNVYTNIQKILEPKKKIKRVRVADFFNGALESEESIRVAIELLQEQLLKLLAEDTTIVIE